MYSRLLKKYGSFVFKLKQPYVSICAFQTEKIFTTKITKCTKKVLLFLEIILFSTVLFVVQEFQIFIL